VGPLSFLSFLDSFLLLANVSLLVLAAYSVLQAKKVSQYPLPFFFFLFSAVFTTLLGLHYSFPDLISRTQYIKLYWANELIEQGFALSMMVAIMRLALAGERSAAIVGQGLASVAVVLVSGLLTDGEMSLSNRWMTGFTRNLSFGVALMNFQVWGLLVAKRVSNREVLLLASGLGLLTTGKSLGHTIRIVAPQGGWVEPVGNYIVVATGILAAFVWWHAFRPSSRPATEREEKRPHLIKAA
jgi:hypothetical protein